MTIEEMVKKFIDEGGSGRLDIQVGKSGVVFLDEGEFISFDDLGYNEQLGFFKRSEFPKQKNEAETKGRNTRARHLEIYNTAVTALNEVGGVLAVDQLPKVERLEVLNKLYSYVTESANCRIGTAKQNVAKAMRRARYGVMQDQWGGARPGSGRPKSNNREEGSN